MTDEEDTNLNIICVLFISEYFIRRTFISKFVIMYLFNQYPIIFQLQ